MNTNLPQNDTDLQEAFKTILTIESLNDYILEIAKLIYNSELNKETLQNILEKHGFNQTEEIKEELLDLLILYINIILNDQVITDNETRNIEILKMYFRIKEGDFYQLRQQEIADILKRQFSLLYLDNQIDSKEEIHNMKLQEMFDLSYDQFEDFKVEEIKKAIERGADLTQLDMAKLPDDFFIYEIPQQIKDFVFERDQRKCQSCGQTEDLDFAYIIPHTKGGSNTLRNLQLLCQQCNREKANKIG